MPSSTLPSVFQQWPNCIEGLGNGDYYGYYWPVGKESSDPLVMLTSHDCGALIPVASSHEALARLRYSREGDEFDDDESTLDWSEKLEMDTDSPHLLVTSADLTMPSACRCLSAN